MPMLYTDAVDERTSLVEKGVENEEISYQNAQDPEVQAQAPVREPQTPRVPPPISNPLNYSIIIQRRRLGLALALTAVVGTIGGAAAGASLPILFDVPPPPPSPPPVSSKEPTHPPTHHPHCPH